MKRQKQFPIFKDKVFINSCSKGVLSREVTRAYKAYLRDWRREGSPWELWVEKLEAVRHAFAALVNARPQEVAVTTSVSDSVSSLVSALDLSGRRNGIVTTDFDFPTTSQIWRAQQARGARISHVAAAGNRIPLSHFADAIDDRTLLVSLPHVCYRNGSMLDVAPIVKLAHERGAWVMLDAYQSLGTMPIDVRALDVDFLVGGALKYLLGSSGLAYLYARRELVSRLDPSATGWFAQANIFAMDVHAHTPAPTARRFEAGTPPVPNLYAGLAGLKLIQSVGLEAIQAQIRSITDAIKCESMRLGFNLASPVDPAAHGPLIALRSHKVDLLVKWLAREDIIVSSRDDNLRISPHFYNRAKDVDRLMSALVKYKDLLV
jgi:selenocysteine lyase/cysteine desulfurase